jgi:hypothetical protein
MYMGIGTHPDVYLVFGFGFSNPFLDALEHFEIYNSLNFIKHQTLNMGLVQRVVFV